MNLLIEASKNPQDFTRYERDGWMVVSEGYEQHYAPLTSQTVSATLDAAGVRKHINVLDVCTGPGMLAAAVVKREASVLGLDFCKQMIGIAMRNVPKASFLVGDAQSLPFDDGSFDAVVCGYGVIHVAEPQKALSEMRRVLKTGGRVSISVWERPTPMNGVGLLFASIKKHGDLAVPLPDGPDSFQFSQKKKMVGALEETGFKEVTAKIIKQEWELNDARDLEAAIMKGGVRARGLLEAQNRSARIAIANAIELGLKQYFMSDGVYRVPMPAIIGAGTK
ncbi:MAG: methyltransferase domain-containing protein [Arenicellales bacterium]